MESGYSEEDPRPLSCHTSGVTSHVVQIDFLCQIYCDVWIPKSLSPMTEEEEKTPGGCFALTKNPARVLFPGHTAKTTPSHPRYYCQRTKSLLHVWWHYHSTKGHADLKSCCTDLLVKQKWWHFSSVQMSFKPITNQTWKFLGTYTCKNQLTHKRTSGHTTSTYTIKRKCYWKACARWMNEW